METARHDRGEHAAPVAWTSLRGHGHPVLALMRAAEGRPSVLGDMTMTATKVATKSRSLRAMETIPRLENSGG